MIHTDAPHQDIMVYIVNYHQGAFYDDRAQVVLPAHHRQSHVSSRRIWRGDGHWQMKAMDTTTYSRIDE